MNQQVTLVVLNAHSDFLTSYFPGNLAAVSVQGMYCNHFSSCFEYDGKVFYWTNCRSESVGICSHSSRRTLVMSEVADVGQEGMAHNHRISLCIGPQLCWNRADTMRKANYPKFHAEMKKCNSSQDPMDKLTNCPLGVFLKCDLPQ